MAQDFLGINDWLGADDSLMHRQSLILILRK